MKYLKRHLERLSEYFSTFNINLWGNCYFSSTAIVIELQRNIGKDFFNFQYLDICSSLASSISSIYRKMWRWW